MQLCAGESSNHVVPVEASNQEVGSSDFRVKMENTRCSALKVRCKVVTLKNSHSDAEFMFFVGVGGCLHLDLNQYTINLLLYSACCSSAVKILQADKGFSTIETSTYQEL